MADQYSIEFKPNRCRLIATSQLVILPQFHISIYTCSNGLI